MNVFQPSIKRGQENQAAGHGGDGPEIHHVAEILQRGLAAEHRRGEADERGNAGEQDRHGQVPGRVDEISSRVLQGEQNVQAVIDDQPDHERNAKERKEGHRGVAGVEQHRQDH
jgi:hypothetical protein